MRGPKEEYRRRTGTRRRLDTQTSKAVRPPGLRAWGRPQQHPVMVCHNYFPAGLRRIIHVFSITSSGAQNPHSPPTSGSSAHREGPPSAPDVPTECLGLHPYIMTRAYRWSHCRHPAWSHRRSSGGWVSRYRDESGRRPPPRNACLSNNAAEDAHQKLEMLQAARPHRLLARPRTSADMTVDERSVPNGPGLVVYQERHRQRAAQGRKPVFWLSAADDPPPHRTSSSSRTTEAWARARRPEALGTTEATRPPPGALSLSV